MSMPPNQYDVVRVVRLRDDRFVGERVFYDRPPQVGDIGAVVEVYTSPSIGYEVECVDTVTGFTIWLDAMYPEEIELVQRVAPGIP